MADPNIRIRRSAVPGKKPTVEQLSSGEIALNTHDGEIFIRRERSGISTDIVRVGSGTTVTNILYVTEDGDDTNTGKKLGDAKATIKAAVEAAEIGTIIKISAGVYYEDNPINLPAQVSIVGESLREVSVKPNNDNDIFTVRNGNYITNISFLSDGNMPNCSIVAFDPTTPPFINQSPYIQNCTNFIEGSTGLKIDGNNAIGPTKSMVLDSFTQYNPNGIGASITNGAYAQLVSMFTICTDKAVYCGTGGACDLTNSNSSFGNFGLVADGVGSLQYIGTSTYSVNQGFDSIIVDLSSPEYNIIDAQYTSETGRLVVTTDSDHNFSLGMGVTMSGIGFTCLSAPAFDEFDNPLPGISTFPSGNNGYIFEINSIPASDQFITYVGISTLDHTYVSGGVVSTQATRPFDGQVAYFEDLYYEVEKVTVSYGGTGYIDTPVITIGEPGTDWGVRAQATATVVNGSITEVDLISNGRGYTLNPSVSITAPGIGTDVAQLTVSIQPKYYLILESSLVADGIYNVKLNDNVPYGVGVGSEVRFFKQSRLLTSGHSFEYIGSGVDIDFALPANGGVPIQKNEAQSLQGGLVVYTSTDHSGNFRVGDGVVINQATGTISGTFYSKSLFSTMTPFILALGGD